MFKNLFIYLFFGVAESFLDSTAADKFLSRNERCGTSSLLDSGRVCAPGLECVYVNTNNKLDENVMRCLEVKKSTKPEKCSKEKCKTIIKHCPSDSFSVINISKARSDDGCCNNQPANTLPICDKDQERVLIRVGTPDQPGKCCDQFECQKRELHCENVKCQDSLEIYDFYSIDGDSCPEDSFRPTKYVPKGSCCPIVAQCQCQPSICQPIKCQPTEILIIEKTGNGSPGTCCTHFRCENSFQIAENHTDMPDILTPQHKKSTSRLRHSKNMHFISALPFCIHEGKKYVKGETWHTDPCQICSCNGDVALCNRIQYNCNWVGIPENECCPVCLGCKDDTGKHRQIGDFWVQDDCTKLVDQKFLSYFSCTCGEDFQWHCQKFFCKIECDNPKKVEGECCPHCDVPLLIEPPITCASLELCPLRCEHGLMKNLWGCFECKCANPSVSEIELPVYDGIDDTKECVPLTAHNCNKFDICVYNNLFFRQCAHGYLRDQNDCPACKCAKCPPIEQCYKNCLYGFEMNAFGCSVSHRKEFPSNKEEKEISDNNNCFSYSDEHKKLLERDSGEWWTDNHCRQCFCQNKKEYCSLISCPLRPANCSIEKWIRDCCATCSEIVNNRNLTLNVRAELSHQSKHGLTVCHSPGNGRLFVDGETWSVGECLDCTCRMGHILCASATCPPIPCSNPIPNPNNKCCLMCSVLPLTTEASLINSSSSLLLNRSQQNTLNNYSLEHGFKTNVESDLYCTDIYGISHPINSKWRQNECMSCACNQLGNIECFQERCLNGHEDEKRCSENGHKSLMIKGHCCAVCSRINHFYLKFIFRRSI